MQEQKLNTKNEKSDLKVVKVEDIIAKYKASDAIYQEVLKATAKYVKDLQKLSDSGRILSDLLLVVADQHGGDLGDGIRTIGDTQKQLEAKRAKLVQNFVESLQEPYQKAGQNRLESEKQEIATFSQKFKSTRSVSLKTVRVHERSAAKLNKKKKKDPNALDQVVANLTQAVESHDTLLGDLLREAVRIDRQKYCYFIARWAEVLAYQNEAFVEGSNVISNVLPALETLSQSEQNIPEEFERLIVDSRPESTYQELRQARETGYFPESYNAGLSDSYSMRAPSASLNRSGGAISTEPDEFGGIPVVPYKARVLQRYDAQNDDELTLSLGDIFDVTSEIDENWAVGTVHGERGMFPVNYVEKMRRAGK